MIPRRILGAPGAHHPGALLSRHAIARHPGAPSWRRYAASEAGENNTGHISIHPNEGIVFFNNLLPVNLQWLHNITSAFDRGPAYSSVLKDDSKWSKIGAVSPSQVVDEAVKNSNLGLGEVKILEVLPRLKEGGAFVKFKHDEATDAATVIEAIKQHMNKNRIRPWLNPFNAVRANLVLGKPWLEDLLRMPSRRLRAEFLPTQSGGEVAELNQEQLYAFFRPYGKLTDIIAQPSDSKIVPRYAYLDFSRLGKSIMAKNCLHGYTVSEAEGGGKLGTIFRLTYEKKQRFGWVKDWIFGHPRIVIPALAALIAGISIAIFDPIRTFSIKEHIQRSWHFADNKAWRWLRSQGEDILNRLRSGPDQAEAGMQVVWDDRRGDIEQIQSWLMESADTFIVVQGPRGSGKKELVVDHALKGQRDAHRVLVIDCKTVQEARSEAATIQAAANQVGYRPVFSWVNNISGLMDLAAQGLTGMKAGFSETLENQLSKIWTNTGAALKSIALEARRKNDPDVKLSDDEYLEAHPEVRPIVVIDNFLHKSNEPGASVVYDKLAEWAARLTTSNIAHVIFLTNDVSVGKSLGNALPDRVFRQISLGDCSPETAKRYVINHLNFNARVTGADKVAKSDGEEERRLTPAQKRADLKELDEVIPLLGGRLTDLEFLARRIKAGETPKKAVGEIIDQSASEIIKMFLLSGNNGNKAFSTTQAWTLIRSLAASDNESLRYHEVLLLDSYRSDGDTALAALEQAELISAETSNGRPYSIKPGRPVYQPAFQRITEDKVLAAKMDMALLAEAIANESKAIDKNEQELRLLGELPKQPAEVMGRILWLLGKIDASQRKIEDYEKRTGGLKEVLLSEF
ncbi:mitochondrial escape protein 2-like [Teratosphaeria destructans]|uniref:Mitochondrial escape protein 2 n=1 Tax=Teratosphaeria destructans TaxID=418781 RepID=A0A9W7SVI1_9PEZI|nr:mitochondrial escape protein 2-like [Teratosphaeria destructans]